MAEYAARVDFLDNRFKAEMLVASDYVKGNGTFEGFSNAGVPKGTSGLRITGITTAGDQDEDRRTPGDQIIKTGEYDNLAGGDSSRGNASVPWVPRQCSGQTGADRPEVGDMQRTQIPPDPWWCF